MRTFTAFVAGWFLGLGILCIVAFAQTDAISGHVPNETLQIFLALTAALCFSISAACASAIRDDGGGAW